jgi:hypothetical protein
MNAILLTTLSLLSISYIIVNIYNYQMASRLRETYREALDGNDIERAIDAGRAYYSKAHGTFTAIEESALQRDLARNGMTSRTGILNR